MQGLNGARRITVRTKTISIRGSALKSLPLSKNLENERWMIPSTRRKGGDRSRRSYSGYKTKQPGGTITTRGGQGPTVNEEEFGSRKAKVEERYEREKETATGKCRKKQAEEVRRRRRKVQWAKDQDQEKQEEESIQN